MKLHKLCSTFPRIGRYKTLIGHPVMLFVASVGHPVIIFINSVGHPALTSTVIRSSEIADRHPDFTSTDAESANPA